MTTTTTTAAAAAATSRSRRRRRHLRSIILVATHVPLLLVCRLLLLWTHHHSAVAALSSSPSSSSSYASSSGGLSKVAVIGTTGRLGRQVVQQLSDMGIPTRCLLRPGADENSNDVVVKSLKDAKTSQQVAAYLKTLPGVEMIYGDVTDIDALRRLLLLDDNGGFVDACFAVHGARMPKPFYKGLLAPLLFNEDVDPQHPKQVNYVGVQNILTVLQECQEKSSKKSKNGKKKVPRLVRITGKGEDPWSVFSILINAFGGMAKAWNYEAEQLIRTSSANNIDYTIIRPGIMKESVEDTTPTLGLRDNGGDLPVTAVSYAQIAHLVINAATRDNCKRATLTAMNIKQQEPGKDAPTVVYQTVDQVQPDSRTTFPTTLLQEHKRAARVGGLAIIVTTLLLANLVASLVLRLFGFAF